MKKVIVLGSLNMDLSINADYMPKKGETMNGYDFLINPGGKGGNQAVAAAKLGADTRMIANVGNDIFGQDILNKLKEYGVCTDDISISKFDSTGVAVIICCDHDNRIILGNGANHTLTFEMVKEKLDEIAEEGDIFLTQLENDFQVVDASIRYAKKKGLYTILNPAPARVLEEDLYKYLDLIVVNQSECQLLTGIYPNDDDSCIKGLQAFENRGAKAIITLGAHGSITNMEDTPVFVDSRKVETVDTTGAGDSYIGALCACLAKDMPVKEALEFSTKVAAITVTRRGAQVSIPYIEEVESYFKEENKHE